MSLPPNYMSTFPKDTAAFIASARKHNHCAIANTATGQYLESALRRIEDGVLLTREEARALAGYIRYHDERYDEHFLWQLRDGYGVLDVVKRLEAKAKEINSAHQH